jgi:hypothetical protein
MEQNKETEAVYVVQIHTDGTYVAHLEQPEEKIAVKRPANVSDVLTVSSGLVKEIENSQLTDRIMIALLTVLQGAQEPTPAEAVKEKLKERGIDPESAPSS